MKRFQEDPLRIMRAIRFMAVTGFSIAQETKLAILRSTPSLQAVSRERQQSELMKMLVGENVGPALLEYRDALAEIIPGLRPCFDFQQNNPYHIYDVWKHTVKAIEKSSRVPIIRLALLFHDVGKPECWQEDNNGVRHFRGHGAASARIADSVLQTLRFNNKTRKAVVELVEVHNQFIKPDLKSVRKLLGKLGRSNLTA